MSANEPEALKEFKSLTGAPDHQARFFLESANWDLETAVTAFYEQDDPGTESHNPTVEDDDDDDEDWSPAQSHPVPTPMQPGVSSGPRAPPSRFATLGSLNREEDDDEEGKQNFFTGGEKSGLSVQGPGQGMPEAARGILDRAEVAPAPPPQEAPTRHFTGTGYTLGSDSQPSQPVPTSQPVVAPRARRFLRLWRNGFSIDDGQLYEWNDPESLELAREIRQGRLPRHLANIGMNEQVELVVEKHETEDWSPQTAGVRQTAFTGHGNRLGSAIPGEPVIPAAPAPVTTSAPAASKPPQATPNIDPSLPQTTIQLRLVDGTRLVTQFNLSSTIEDMYAFVAGARPTGGREFVLQTIFPTRVLEKSGKSIEEEGLKAGTVVMRWKA